MTADLLVCGGLKVWACFVDIEFMQNYSGKKRVLLLDPKIWLLVVIISGCDNGPPKPVLQDSQPSADEPIYTDEPTPAAPYVTPTPVAAAPVATSAIPGPTPTPTPIVVNLASIDLQGYWTSTAGGVPCAILEIGTNLTLVDGQGNQSTGSITSASTIVANNWGPLKGTLSEDKKKIQWSNGMVWTFLSKP